MINKTADVFPLLTKSIKGGTSVMAEYNVRNGTVGLLVYNPDPKEADNFYLLFNPGKTQRVFTDKIYTFHFACMEVLKEIPLLRPKDFREIVENALELRNKYPPQRPMSQDAKIFYEAGPQGH